MPTNKSVSPTEFRLHSKLFNVDCAPSNYFEQLRFEMIFQQIITWFWRTQGVYFFIQKVKKMDQKILFQFFFYKTYIVGPVGSDRKITSISKSVDGLSHSPLKIVKEVAKREAETAEAEKRAEEEGKEEKAQAVGFDKELIKGIEAEVLAESQAALEKRKEERLLIGGPEMDMTIEWVEKRAENPIKKAARDKRKQELLEREETEWDLLAIWNPELFFYLLQFKKKVYSRTLGFKKIKKDIRRRFKCRPKRLKTLIYYKVKPDLEDKLKKKKARLIKKRAPKKKRINYLLVSTNKYTKVQLSFNLFFTYFFLHFFKSQSILLTKSLYRGTLTNALFQAEQNLLMRKIEFLEKHRWGFDFIFLLNYALTFSNTSFVLPFFLSQVVQKFKQLRYAKMLFNILRHFYFYKRNICAIKVLVNGPFNRHGRSHFKMLHIGNLALSNMHSCVMYDAIQWRTPYGAVSLKLGVYYANYFMIDLLKVGNGII